MIRSAVALALLTLILCTVAFPSVAVAADTWKQDAGRILPALGLDEGHWWVLGSFQWVKEPRMFWGDRPLPPDGKFDLTATYEGRKGPAKWQEVPEWDQDGRAYEITTKAGMEEDPEECTAGYLYRQVDSPADARAILYLGCDDGAVLNLNGKVIFQRFYYRSAERRQEAIPIRLRKGRNDFLLKIVDKDNTSSSSFVFEIEPDTTPARYAAALEQLISRHADDAANVINAEIRLVHLYRQMGSLNKADALAARIRTRPGLSDEQKQILSGYSNSRTTGIGVVSSGRVDGNRAAFKTRKGTLYVAYWQDAAPRITFVPDGVAWPYAPSHRPVPVAFSRPNTGKVLSIADKADRYVVRGRQLSTEVLKDGSGVIFDGPERRRFIEMGMVDKFKRMEWFELKTHQGPFETLAMHLDTREGVYGMGHRYDTFNRRGRFNSVGNCDRGFGESHFTLPYFTTQGHDALLINSYGDGEIDVDRVHIQNAACSKIREDVIDFFYFTGKPKSLVRQYVDLTGHTVMPPDWTLGVWFSRNSYEDEDVVLDVAKKLRQYNVPAHVLVLEAWREDGDDWMKWNTKNWPHHEEMCKTLHEMGFKVVIWTMQFHVFSRKNPAAYETEAFDKRYFCLEGDKPWGFDQATDKNSYIVDFFNPDAIAWWERCYKPLFDPVTGIDGLKTDIGENNGGSTYQGWRDINNIYALGYIRTAWEMTKKITAEGMVFARTGTVGTQQYPILWAGDHMTWFQGQQDALNAMLNSGLSGYAWTSFDVGGLFGDLDKETYVRMAEMGAFCPIMQCHGLGRREPYDFGDYKEEAVEVFNRYANWHMEMKPYRVAMGRKAVETGVPIMRPLWMEFPNDPACYEAEYQYFFGDDILVAPIVSYNHTRELYLPGGEWIDWWTGKAIQGGRTIEVTMPLEKTPVYVRPGADVLKIAPGTKGRK